MASRTSSSRAKPIPNPLGAATNVPPLSLPMLVWAGVLWIVLCPDGVTRVEPHRAPVEQVRLMWSVLTAQMRLTFSLFYLLCSTANHNKLDDAWSGATKRILAATKHPERGDAVLGAVVSFCKYAASCPSWRGTTFLVQVLRGDDIDFVVTAANKMIMQVCHDEFNDPKDSKHTYAEKMATGAAIAFVTSLLADYQPATKEQWAALFVAAFCARHFSTQLPALATGGAHARAAEQCACAVMALMSPPGSQLGNCHETAIELT